MGFFLKGLNYYVFTGGKNLDDTGRMADIYDYNALVHYDGQKNKTFPAFQAFDRFVKKHKRLPETKRQYSVQIGFEWEEMQLQHVINTSEEHENISFNTDKLSKLGMSLLSSKYQAKYVELKGELDLTKPLVLCGSTYLSKDAEMNILDFVDKGGRLLIFGNLPSKNWQLEKTNALSDIFKNEEFVGYNKNYAYALSNDKKIYGISFAKSILVKDEACKVKCKDKDGNILGIEKTYGKGRITLITGTFSPANVDQIELLEELLDENGAQWLAYSTNRNIQVSVLSDGEKDLIFALNLYTGEMETDIVYIRNGKQRKKRLKLKPQQVKCFTINRE